MRRKARKLREASKLATQQIVVKDTGQRGPVVAQVGQDEVGKGTELISELMSGVPCRNAGPTTGGRQGPDGSVSAEAASYSTSLPCFTSIFPESSTSSSSTFYLATASSKPATIDLEIATDPPEWMGQLADLE